MLKDTYINIKKKICNPFWGLQIFVVMRVSLLARCSK